jgi:uncharacterized protein YndB with AHSA1/START domain
MIDVIRQIEAVQRETGTGRLAAGDARTVSLRRTYAAPVEDVWDALTTPDRISRWFLPVSGDYRLGGTYQFEGNAGGEILECERPNRLKVTWVFGPPDAPASEVELRLTPASDESTVLVLEHTAMVPDEIWDHFGPGAVGVGWEGGFLGLALHLEDNGAVGDTAAWPYTEEGHDFYSRSSAAWGEANRAAGASDEMVARTVAATTEFYSPSTPPPTA